MRRVRALVSFGWLWTAGMLVTAVSCNDNVDQSAGDGGPDSSVDTAAKPVADAAEDSSDSSQGPPDATKLDGTAADSEKPGDAAPSETGPDSAVEDSSADGLPPDDGSSPIPEASTDSNAPADGGEADSPPSDSSPGEGGSVACGDAAVGATECALLARSPDCLACALQIGCLDPSGLNLSCDQFDGDAQGDCLATLTCVLGAGCGVTVDDPSCLCGSDDASACAGGTEAPTGACKDTYFSGFGTQNVEEILASFNDPTTPSGDANVLVQCLQFQPCTACF
jgi:hypothetical protein